MPCLNSAAITVFIKASSLCTAFFSALDRSASHFVNSSSVALSGLQRGDIISHSPSIGCFST